MPIKYNINLIFFKYYLILILCNVFLNIIIKNINILNNI